MKFELFIESLRTKAIDSQLMDTILEAYDIIFEATVEEVREKYYSDFNKSDFYKINEADPTSKGGKRKGKFLPWLLKLRKSKKLKMEDLYKVKKYLTVFSKYRHKLSENDINKMDSIPALYEIVKSIIEIEDKSDSLKSNVKPDSLKSKKEISDDIKNEVVKVYEDDTILAIIPKTYRASCKYGKNTQWCTASTTSDRMFEQYSSQGPLYIVIDKVDNEKYQFHLPSSQYMDATDSSIEDIPDFIAENDSAMRALSPALVDLFDDQQSKEYLTPEVRKELATNNLKYYYMFPGVAKFSELNIGSIKSKYEVQDFIQLNGVEYFVIDSSGGDSFVDFIKDQGIVSFTEDEIHGWYSTNDYNLTDDSYTDLTDLTENSIKLICAKFSLNPTELPKSFSDWDTDELEPALEFLNEVYGRYQCALYEEEFINNLVSHVGEGTDMFCVLNYGDDYKLLGNAREIVEDEYSYNYDGDFEMPIVDITTDYIGESYPDNNPEFFNELISDYIDE